MKTLVTNTNKADTSKDESVLDKRYVIRVHDSDPRNPVDNGVNYWYNPYRSYYTLLAFTEDEIEFAKNHAYKTREGAERGIEKIKRYCMPGPQTRQDFESVRSQGLKHWMEKKVKEQDWENSHYTFSVITLDEMFDEVNKELEKMKEEFKPHPLSHIFKKENI